MDQPNDTTADETPVPEDAPQPLTLYAWVAMLPQRPEGGGPIVPAMIMQGPQGPQATPLLAFGEEQALQMRELAQAVANGVNASVHLLKLGTPEFVEGLDPKAISVAQQMPSQLVLPPSRP